MKGREGRGGLSHLYAQSDDSAAGAKKRVQLDLKLEE